MVCRHSSLYKLHRGLNLENEKKKQKGAKEEFSVSRYSKVEPKRTGTVSRYVVAVFYRLVIILISVTGTSTRALGFFSSFCIILENSCVLNDLCDVNRNDIHNKVMVIFTPSLFLFQPGLTAQRSRDRRVIASKIKVHEFL